MKITIVKVGGAVVEDPAQLTSLLEGFKKIEGAKILVHVADDVQQRLLPH